MLVPGDVLSLSGELGAGKTVIVQGVARGLGVETRVTSPSFTLVHTYKGVFRIVHLDVYRLSSFQEVLDLGFDELLDPQAIALVEWGEAVAPLLPRVHLEIDIRSASPELPSERTLEFRPRGPEWRARLARLEEVLPPGLKRSTGGDSGPPVASS